MKTTNKLGTLIGSLVLASAITMLIPSLSLAKDAHHSKASKKSHHSKSSKKAHRSKHSKRHHRGHHHSRGGEGSTENTNVAGYEIIEYNGQQWLDRNLGADEACISTFVTGTDACMGDYYQWGRSADGHEDINSELTDVLSSSLNPGHNEFIITDNVGTLNWIDHNEVDLWQEPGNANNGVCPAGWRVPTKSEFEALNITDSLDAFTKIKLHHSGYRNDEDGYVSHSNLHINGFYWTSTVKGEASIGFRINNAAVSTYFNDWGRANGFQIRCIKH